MNFGLLWWSRWVSVSRWRHSIVQKCVVNNLSIWENLRTEGKLSTIMLRCIFVEEFNDMKTYSTAEKGTQVPFPNIRTGPQREYFKYIFMIWTKTVHMYSLAILLNYFLKENKLSSWHKLNSSWYSNSVFIWWIINFVLYHFISCYIKIYAIT